MPTPNIFHIPVSVFKWKCQILKLLSTGHEMSYTINVTYEYPLVYFSSYLSKETATMGSQWISTTTRDLKSSSKGT